MSSQPAAKEQLSAPVPVPRKKLFLRLVIIAVGLAGLASWSYQRYTHVFTDDARIAATMVEVSSKVSGWVTDMHVTQGDAVSTGHVLAVIDARKISLYIKELAASLQALDARHARLHTQTEMVGKQTQGNISAAESMLIAAKASLASMLSERELRRGEWQRADQLKEKNILSQQQWENTRHQFRKAEEDYRRAQAVQASAEAKLIEAEAGVDKKTMLERELQTIEYERQQMLLRIEQQQLTLDDHTLTAPVNAVIDKTYVDAGEYLSPGKRVLLMHNPNEVWIDASFKETAIRYLKLGQLAKIGIDAYPDMKLSGKVIHIGDTTTSQFSLLPNTNPSGNFTKITQRLPVKIAIEQDQGLLKPGMMVEVSINVR